MESGDTIGKYRLVRPLGRGGMGEVWLATAIGAGGFAKTVVLKTLLPELATDHLFVEMLTNEARLCARLNHPNLIGVFDFTEHDGVYLLAMEYVDGQPLGRLMKVAAARGWELPAWFALRVAWECCQGLQFAHDQGVIHCDLSPSNVMVTFAGVTKILDFGVAHSSARGPKADRLKGKFPYMAPERIKSLTTDRRTDIYSLGVMLYLLFTGQLPFSAETDAALLYKMVTEQPPRPSRLRPIAPEIEGIILRAIQPDPEARFQTAAELIEALSPCLAGQLGTYGQQDAASFINAVFESTSLPRPPRLAAGTHENDPLDDEITRRPSDSAPAKELVVLDEDLDAVVLDIESDLEVAREPSPAPLEPFMTNARASSSIKPLTVFGEPLPARERTSVQSLFGGLPPSSMGPSRVFDRPPLETPDPEPEPRWLEPEPEREERRGVFAGYSSSRSSSPVAWPWKSSRSKSD